MKANRKLALAVLIGIAIGIAGATAIHARQVNGGAWLCRRGSRCSGSRYVSEVCDEGPETLASFNGHYLIRGGKTASIEGDAPKRFVVIAFDSMEKAQAWEDSPAYEAIKPIRHSSAKSRVFIAEGVAPK